MLQSLLMRVKAVTWLTFLFIRFQEVGARALHSNPDLWPVQHTQATVTLNSLSLSTLTRQGRGLTCRIMSCLFGKFCTICPSQLKPEMWPQNYSIKTLVTNKKVYLLICCNCNSTKCVCAGQNQDWLEDRRWLLTGQMQENNRNNNSVEMALNKMWRRGTTPDLSWTQNTLSMVKRVQLVRKAGLSHRPLTPAYRGVIESILTAGITVWYGNTAQAERKPLQRVIKKAKRITGRTFLSWNVCTSKATGKSRGDRQRPTAPSSLSAPTQNLHVQSETQQSGQHHCSQKLLSHPLFLCHSQTDGKTKLPNLCQITCENSRLWSVSSVKLQRSRFKVLLRSFPHVV